jgi:hypothetical protein
MGIKVGKVQRRRGGAVPQLRAAAGDLGAGDVAASIRRGTAEVSRGIQTFAQGAANLAAGIGEARARAQEKKDSVSALEAENNFTVDITERLGQLKNENQGSKAIQLGDALDNEIKALESRHLEGLSPAAKERARATIQAATQKAKISAVNFTVDELNKAEIQARQNKLENTATAIQNEPTVSNYTVGRAVMMAELESSDLPPEAKDELRPAISDKLAVSYFMGKQPSEAVAEFEAMKDGKLDPMQNVIYEAMSGEAKTKLEKELKVRERAFKQAKKQEDIETDNQLILDAQKQVYTNPDVARAATPAGARALEKINRDKGKEVKAEVRERQYLDTSKWLRLSDNPSAVTNAEIIERVDNPKDQEHFIQVRDRYKKARLTNVDYKAMLKNMAEDFGQGKFGEGQEGRREYAAQLETFERYMIETPDANARDYYDNLMDPRNVEFYNDKLLGIIPFTGGDLSPEDLRISREKQAEVLNSRRGVKRRRYNPETGEFTDAN